MEIYRTKCLNKYLPLKIPDDILYIFCTFSSPTNLFKEAGFKNVAEREVACEMKCETAEIYWHMMTQIAAPVVAALSEADYISKDKIKREVYELVNEKCQDGNLILNGSSLLIYGEKSLARN